VALVAGGHTFGKGHGAGDPSLVGAEPEGAPIEQMGFGWKNSFGDGKGVHTTTSGIEGAWTPTPTQWDNSYFETLFGWEWELTKSPAGAQQWTAIGAEGTVPDAHDPSRSHAPMMTTADMALRMDAIYEPISRDFYANPDKFHDAYARAWFKLIHRDMGPKVRYLGPDVPAEELLWQDPLPTGAAALSDADVASLKAVVLASDLSIAELVETAWASASSYRGSDHRGGANGARIALAPQKDWEANNPEQLAKVLDGLRSIQSASGIKVSLADLIVIAGSAAVEQAAKNGGHAVNAAITTGRVDATQEQTDVEGFAVLEPIADGFRNYLKKEFAVSAEELLVDKAQLLTLTAPEMTALVGGLRTISGAFTDEAEALSTDFFKNIVDMGVSWSPAADHNNAFEGVAGGEVKWMGTRVDLVFGSNSQLRALSEAFAQSDADAAFAQTFADAWTKVMNLDRFDLV
jgi:catalase-peroxidase